MSEEFGYSVGFQCESEDAINLLKDVASSMDRGEYGEIEGKLNISALSFTSPDIKKLIEDVYYRGSLAKALAVHAAQCHAELGVESDSGMSSLESLQPSAEGKYIICAEGTDREAYEFCTYLTIFLHAMGAKNINAGASGSYWYANWNSAEGNLTWKMQEEDMEY